MKVLVRDHEAHFVVAVCGFLVSGFCCDVEASTSCIKQPD